MYDIVQRNWPNYKTMDLYGENDTFQMGECGLFIDRVSDRQILGKCQVRLFFLANKIEPIKIGTLKLQQYYIT
jgi:hypothetical protein